MDGATPTPDSNGPASDEQIRKVYVQALKEKEAVHTVFRVGTKAKHTGRSGKGFLSLTLQDRTGEVDARIFENVEAAAAAFAEGDFLLVQGHTITWQKKLQVVIDRLEKLDPTPLDPAEFTPAAPTAEAAAEAAEAPAPERAEKADRERAEQPARGGGQGAQHVQHIREIAGRVHDPHVRALLFAFLDDPSIGEPLKVAPAAKGIHHAYRGGLAEHLHSVMRLAHRIADHYPQADRDLLVAGALLHDILKVKEISSERGFEYTDEGRLVGHITMTAQAIREKASRLEAFPALLEQHLTHIVISHHGQLEWGSPKLPMTLEAMLVHMLDSIDSRVASWLEIMQKDQNERWTENARLYDRHLWKGPVPTTRGRAPVPPRHKGQKDGHKEQHREHAKEPRREQPHRERKHEPRKAPPAPAPKAEESTKFSFKPFAALTGTQDGGPKEG
ncbi:MAG: HD domain-containing protein [Deltaproteobacteria bacterium]|nr:HD domain-containing protein [Deltaproteobacteria bacterium]